MQILQDTMQTIQILQDMLQIIQILNDMVQIIQIPGNCADNTNDTGFGKNQTRTLPPFSLYYWIPSKNRQKPLNKGMT